MTAPGSSGGSSPLRVGGIALLGLGVVAGLIGLGSLVLGGDDAGDPTAAPPGSTAPADPSAGAEPPPGAGDGTGDGDGDGDGDAQGFTRDDGVPVPSFGPTPTAGVPAPGAGPQAGAGPGAGGGSGAAGGVAAGDGARSESVARLPLRVYNNSTIPGLAARAAADFEAAGWTVTEIGGYDGRIPTSTVYYRPGTDEQAAADQLAAEFGLRSEPRFEGIEAASPGVIVIVTQDYQTR